MSKFQTCPNCGAHLDSGERCDCEREDRDHDLPACGEEIDRPEDDEDD